MIDHDPRSDFSLSRVAQIYRIALGEHMAGDTTMWHSMPMRQKHVQWGEIIGLAAVNDVCL